MNHLPSFIQVLHCTHPPEHTRDTQLCPQIVETHGTYMGLKTLCELEFGFNFQPGEHSSVSYFLESSG